MHRPGLGKTLLACLALLATSAAAQLTIPTIVVLPSEDFVWQWGSGRVDDRERASFEIFGGEEKFHCTLTGSFRLGSRMRDFYELRDFEHAMSSTLYFIQDATNAMNRYYQNLELDWAILDCAVPVSNVSPEKQQEKLDRARERAERDRERRRAREQDDD